MISTRFQSSAFDAGLPAASAAGWAAERHGLGRVGPHHRPAPLPQGCRRRWRREAELSTSVRVSRLPRELLARWLSSVTVYTPQVLVADVSDTYTPFIPFAGRSRRGAGCRSGTRPVHRNLAEDAHVLKGAIEHQPSAGRRLSALSMDPPFSARHAVVLQRLRTPAIDVAALSRVGHVVLGKDRNSRQ